MQVPCASPIGDSGPDGVILTSACSQVLHVPQKESAMSMIFSALSEPSDEPPRERVHRNPPHPGSSRQNSLSISLSWNLRHPRYSPRIRAGKRRIPWKAPSHEREVAPMGAGNAAEWEIGHERLAIEMGSDQPSADPVWAKRMPITGRILIHPETSTRSSTHSPRSRQTSSTG